MAMRILTWNCRGIVNSTRQNALLEIIRQERPKIVFLSETMCDDGQDESVRMRIGFDHCLSKPVGDGCRGLALLWLEEALVRIQNYSTRHISAFIGVSGAVDEWRFTGVYGFPKPEHHSLSWDLLRLLYNQSSLPWMVSGDFNAITAQREKAGGYPSPLNYHFFPKSCCTSVNEVICHGIPDARKLEDGDIVNVDVTVYYKGVHGDLNDTYFVGNVDEESRRLVQCTYECLEKAISIVKPGVRFREIGDVINRHATMSGFSVVKSICGHGIGDLFHCAPNIPHYAKNKAVGVMKAGQTFTIEPMINAGVWRDRMWPDGWTVVTADGKRSAQFEHTLLVTENGVEVLTARLPSSPKVYPWLDV